MSTFHDIVRSVNTVLVAVIAVVLAIVAALCLLVAADVVAPADIAPSGWIRDQFGELDGLTGADRMLAIVISAIVVGLGLLLLVFESIPALMPSRTYASDASGQTVMIDRGTIQQMVERSARETDNVTFAHADLRDVSNGLSVNLRAGLVPDANIAKTSRILETKIKDDLRDHAGISVASVRLELEYMPRERGERGSERKRARPA